MNEEAILKKLVRASRGDSPPLLDVSGAVMTDVMPPVPSGRTLLWVFATISSAAAVIIMTLALRVMTLQQDPFGEMVRSAMASIR